MTDTPALTVPDPDDLDQLRRTLAAGRQRCALAAAARGWHVFPLRPGDKRPLWRSWAAHATTDPARIRAWAGWQPGARPADRVDNIGIACAPSGLVVLDLDRPHPGEQPPAAWAEAGVIDGADAFAVLCERHGHPVPLDTFTVATRRGGLHLYFTAPAGVVIANNSNGRNAWLVDVRSPGTPGSDGGYVVAPGSFVEADRNGPAGTYEVLDDRDPAQLPSWLATVLAWPSSAHTLPELDGRGKARLRELLADGDRAGAYAAAALRGEIEKVTSAVPGTRNHTLFASAAALGGLVAAGLLPRDLAEQALTAAAALVGPDARKNADAITRGLDRGMTAGRTLPEARR